MGGSFKVERQLFLKMFLFKLKILILFRYGVLAKMKERVETNFKILV